MRSRYPLAAFAIPLVAVLASTASAQNNTWNGNKINGVPASVTSFGFGGRPGYYGVPASVTSLNFGTIPNAGTWRPHGGFGAPQHHRNHTFANPYYGSTYYVPYAYPVYIDSGYDSAGYDSQAPAPQALEPDAAQQVRNELESLQRTVRDYRDELRATRVTEQAVTKPEPEQPAASQPETVLVFKDGHQVQVGNYAIVGSTLYDLSEGRTKKVALAELDVPATVKQNDDRGVEFRVPISTGLN